MHIRWGAGLPPPAPQEGGNDESRKQRKQREKKQKRGISPYCTVSAGPAACVSRPVDGSQDAQWRESFFMYIRCVLCCRAKKPRNRKRRSAAADLPLLHGEAKPCWPCGFGAEVPR